MNWYMVPLLSQTSSKWLFCTRPDPAEKRSLNSYSGLYSSFFRDGRRKRPTCWTVLTAFFFFFGTRFSLFLVFFIKAGSITLQLFFTATPCISLKGIQVLLFSQEKSASLLPSMSRQACLYARREGTVDDSDDRSASPTTKAVILDIETKDMAYLRLHET